MKKYPQLFISVWIPPKIVKKLGKGFNHFCVATKYKEDATIDFIGTNHRYFINGKEIKL